MSTPDLPKPKDGPLSGVRVLDIATMIAAPLAASILGDYGAEVVKIELPGRGDTGRKMGAQRDGIGLYWRTLGRNKLSVALDLHKSEAQDLIKRWIGQFDILIENFRPGTLDRYNLGVEELRRLNPKLVVLQMTAFGQTGPYRERHGFGTLAETMSGVSSVLVKDIRGFSNDRPALTSFPLGDVTAGLVGVNGILAALYRAQKTGQGEVIDLAIYEALLKFMELEIISYDADHPPVVSALRKPDSAPRGVYQCRDGCWIAISASTQPVAVRFLNLLGGEGLVQDPRFLNNELRVANVDALDELVDHWCGALTAAEATRLLSEAGCAVGPVETVASLLQNPQVVARQSIVDVEDSDQGMLHMTNVIPRFQHFPPQKPVPGPVSIGAHTAAVLQRDLQLSQADITALQQRGVIG